MKTPTLDKIANGAIRSLSYDQRMGARRELALLRENLEAMKKRGDEHYDTICEERKENEALLKRAELYESDTTGRRIIVELRPMQAGDGQNRELMIPTEPLFITAVCEKPGVWISTFCSTHFHEARDYLVNVEGDGVAECPGCGRTWWGQHRCECGKTLVDLETLSCGGDGGDS